MHGYVRTTLSLDIYKVVTRNDSNEIRTHNHLVRKQTLNHLAKLACDYLNFKFLTK